MPVDRLKLFARKASIERKIQDLEVTKRQLHQALDEINHGSRRVDDMLTRLGGRSAEFEQQRILLQQNRKLTTDDLEQAKNYLNALERELAEVNREIQQLDTT